MSDVEIWLAQKEELSWFLRSNTEIECFLSYQNAARSETDFFNRIGRKLPLTSAVYASGYPALRLASTTTRRMLCHQLYHPVDKYLQLGADMPVRWVGQVERHRLQLPVLEQR